MSIGLTFTARARKKELFINEIEELAADSGYGLTVNDGWLRVSFCPMGELTMEWKKESGMMGQWLISGECCSTPSGAGFHAAVVRFLDELGKKALKNLEVSDDTEFYGHRDFERMKREHFYPWLNALKRHCAERGGEYSNFCLCWDLDQYQPEEIKGSVITPMGRFDIKKMMEQVEEHGIGWLAERFFIWDAEEKDALYYRNCAIHFLWEECYFVPSGRSEEDRACNERILDSLERAAGLDHSLPLPLSSYREICGLAGRKPVIGEDVREMETDFPIGYRKGTVTHAFGDLRITLPGNCLYEWEEYEDGEGCSMWWNPGTDEPVWRVSGFKRREGKAEFSERSLERDREEFDIPGGRVRIGWNEEEEDGQPLFQAVCEAVSGPSLFLITATFIRSEEKEGIYALLRKLKAVEHNEEVNHTESYNQ